MKQQEGKKKEPKADKKSASRIIIKVKETLVPERIEIIGDGLSARVDTDPMGHVDVQYKIETDIATANLNSWMTMIDRMNIPGLKELAVAKLHDRNVGEVRIHVIPQSLKREDLGREARSLLESILQQATANGLPRTSAPLLNGGAAAAAGVRRRKSRKTK